MSTVLQRLFPNRLDNDYRGHPVALWLFVPITLATLVRSGIHVFAPDGGAQSIATIPLDRMTQGGAEGVVMVFALWGLSQFLLGFIYAAVLLRYRAFLPFMYLLLIVEYVGRASVGWAKPIVTVETAPGARLNFVMPVVALILLGLSLRSGVRDASRAASGELD